MTVTVSYTLEFVKNLDLAQGPANVLSDVTSLASGGFAVAGSAGGLTFLDVFSPLAIGSGLTAPINGFSPVVDQLSNGNIAAVTYDGSVSVDLTLTTAAGVIIESGQFFSTLESHNDIAALSGGGFWIVRDFQFLNSTRDIGVTIGNNDGGFVGFVNLTASIAPNAFSPSAAGLDNGNVAVAWKDSLNSINVGIYTPSGSVIAAPVFAGTTDAASKLALTATAKGFALAYTDNVWGTGGSDITLKQFGFDGALLLTSNVSNPSLFTSTAKESQPALTRLSNDFLGVAYKLTIPPVDRTDPTIIDTVAIAVDPITGSPLVAKNILGGEAATDTVETPAIAGFANGGVAVFHRNGTDNDIDGEHLRLERFSTGDAAANVISGDNLTDEMNGGGGTDSLRGLGSNDILNGGDSGDTIDGGSGCDLMAGGRGADIFVYKSTADSPGAGFICDRITDFRHLTDKINLKAIDAKAHAVGNNSFFFKGTQAFTGEGQVRVFQSGANTIVEINTTGTKGAEMTIQLDKIDAPSLSLADFFL